MKNLRKALMDLGDTWEYIGYLQKGRRDLWNGWENPWFTREVAERIYNNLIINDNEYNYELIITENETLQLVDDLGEIHDTAEKEIIDGMELYRVLSFGWCWSDITNDYDLQEQKEFLEDGLETFRIYDTLSGKAFYLKARNEQDAINKFISEHDYEQELIEQCTSINPIKEFL